MDKSDDIIDVLNKILKVLSVKQTFAAGTTLVNQVGFAIMLIFSLSLNDAFKQTFGLIKMKGSSLFGAWMYVVIITPICFLLSWLLYKYILPFASNQMDSKK